LAHEISDFNAGQIIEGVITAGTHLMIVLKFELAAQAVGIFRKYRANIEKVIAGRLVFEAIFLTEFSVLPILRPITLVGVFFLASD